MQTGLAAPDRSGHYDHWSMGHRHTKEEILDGALATALAGGLSRLTYGRVAKQLGINDRTVVYYFATKDELISDVLFSIGAQLQQTLEPAFSVTAADHLGLLRVAWPILAQPGADPVFALFFEANGLAAAGRTPYVTLVPLMVEAWVAWVMGFLEGTDHERRTEAEATIAVIDGLLLLRQLSGAAAADRAAQRLGIC